MHGDNIKQVVLKAISLTVQLNEEDGVFASEQAARQNSILNKALKNASKHKQQCIIS